MICGPKPLKCELKFGPKLTSARERLKHVAVTRRPDVNRDLLQARHGHLRGLAEAAHDNLRVEALLDERLRWWWGW